MKTIKIFLASSEELDNDRMAFGNLVRRLDDMYEKRGIRIKLFEWEDYDAAYNDRRKQDEYNDHVRQSGIFLALFHKKAGKFTVEEFDIASQEFKDHASPKVYTYCKDLKPGEEESSELKEFKERLFNEMGHYWCRYDNRESLQFQFVMQLQLVESNRMDDVKVEDGVITINGLPVAKMENLKFAACNEGFKKRQAELKELREVIAELQASLAKKQRKLERKKADYEENPDDEDCLEDYQDAKEDVDKLTDDLQKKLDRKNALEEEFEREQQNLFNTARRIMEQRGQKISERMARAIEAFESGDAQRADVILDEAERDFEEARKDFRITKKVSIQALEEQIQRASYKMSNDSIPIEERVAKTLEIYKEADAFAQEINYEQEKYIKFLWGYSGFLHYCAHHDKEIDKAIDVCNRLIKMCEDFFGKEHLDTARSYYNIGSVYADLGDYDKALDCLKQALDIYEKVLGKENFKTVNTYHEIGNVYRVLCDYDKALDYYKQALDILEKVLGKEHSRTVKTYNNIGNVYKDIGDYNRALEYYQQALDIREKVLGKEHPSTADSYNKIGSVYSKLGNYDKALEYHQRALDIYERVHGKEVFKTVNIYHKIGNIYSKLGCYDKALEWYSKATKRYKRYYNKLAWTYHLLGKYEEALPWAEKAVAAFPNKPRIINTLAIVYQGLGRYEEALQQFELCLKLYKEQDNSEGINRTETKVAELKKLMNSAHE